MNPKKTQAGQRFQFSASLYNDLIDVVKWAKSQGGLAGAGQTGMRSTATNVQVKNDSGGDIARFGVIEISSTVGTGLDFENLKALKGTKPTTALKPVAIAQAPSKNGEMVEAVVGGTTMARVDVKSTSDTHAEPVSGSDTLRSGTAGRFRILHPLSSTGVQNVMVRFEAGIAKSLPQVKNLSSFTVPPWGFLVVDGVDPFPSQDLTGFQSAPVLRGYAPSGNFNSTHKRLVSVPGGAVPGQTVDCVLDGFVPARIYSTVVTDPVMAHATANDGVNGVTRLSCTFDQTHFGLPIIFRESGTGEKWGLVDLTPMNQPGSLIGSTAMNRPAVTTLAAQTTPFVWGGNPWNTTQVLRSSGTFAYQPTSNMIMFGSNTSFMGDSHVRFKINFTNCPIGSGIIRIPGYEVEIGFYNLVGGSASTMYCLPAKVVKMPHLASQSDGANWTDYQSLSIPMAFTSAGGLNTNSGLQMYVKVYHLGGSGSGNIVFTLENANLTLHEVDPLSLNGHWRSTGLASGGGTISSGPVKDPLAPPGNKVSSGTGRVKSGGLASVKSTTGIGFE